MIFVFMISLHTFIPCFSLEPVVPSRNCPRCQETGVPCLRPSEEEAAKKANVQKEQQEHNSILSNSFLFFVGVINQLFMKLHGSYYLVPANVCGICLLRSAEARRNAFIQGSWVSTWRTGARRKSAMLRWSRRRVKGWAGLATVAMSHLAKSFLRCCLAPCGGYDTDLVGERRGAIGRWTSQQLD